MKNLINFAVLGVVVGAALAAGESLWENVLEEKVFCLADKLKKKKEIEVEE